MATAVAVEDMRSVDPVAYIRATGLRPEDSYGFLPLDLNDVTPYIFIYRDRPEYEERRVNLPGPEFVKNYGGIEVMPTQTSDMRLEQLPGGMADNLTDVIAAAQQMQEQWAGQGVAGGPNEPVEERLARLDKLKEMGALNQAEYDQMASEIKGGDAGPSPGGADAAPTPANAPQIVAQRLYPGLHLRMSRRQLNHFAPRYVEQLQLCSEDVYGVYPRFTRISTSSDDSNTVNWDDYWIVYRDRPEYAAGRDAWAEEMNKKGRWPETEFFPGVAEAGTSAYAGGKIQVEKDGWPRHTLVMKEKGSDLGESLREKIGKWGYEPEQSIGMSPSFGSGKIYFAWNKG